MKQYFSYLIIAFVCSAAMLFSCTDSDEGVKIAKPGVYFAEAIVEALNKPSVQNTSLTKGITSSNTDFDLVYDPDYIYLHVLRNDTVTDAVRIPLYTQDCSHNINPVHKQCKCFRYRMVVNEDGSAVVTPILEDGSLASSSLTILPGEKCYYSSVDYNIWELPNGNIETTDNITYYERDTELNKEIYRSAADFSIYELAEDMDMLVMNRTVACFNLIGYFYNGDNMYMSEEEEDVAFEVSEFEEIMGSSPTEWYIKMYIGGKGFTDKFNIGLKKSIGTTDGGYYYNTGGFVQLTKRRFSYAGIGFQCYGYGTRKNNNLLTPVHGDEAIDVYLLIKHWDGEGNPTADWLASDDNALYTRVNLTGNSNISPVNNCFYILGLMMDVHQFKIAWDRASSELNKIPGRGKNELRYFSLPDTKVICEVY